MGCERKLSLVDSEATTHFVNPGLIFSDTDQLIALVYISATVSHARNQDFGSGFERGYQRGSHAFQVHVVRGGAHHLVVSFLKGLGQHLGAGLARLGDETSQGIDSELRGAFAGLRATHAVRDDIEPSFGREQVIIFVVRADTTRVG